MSGLREHSGRYVDERVAAGDSLAEAEANANSSIQRLFPNGSPAAGQLVGRSECSQQIVGYLWIGIATSDPEKNGGFGM